MENNGLNFLDLFETLGRVFIMVTVVYVLATAGVITRTLNIVVIILMIWVLYPAIRFVYYSFKLAFAKPKKKK